MQNQTRPRIGATVLGYPRIGRDRELKKALEAFWAGRITGPDLDAAAEAVRLDGLKTMRRAGLDSVPVNTFSWYDQVLDTAVLVGAVPERFAAVAGEHRLAGFDAARYFAMARGTSGVAPLEMTKWFDTNYHYLVPEVDAATPFTLHADKPLSEVAEGDRLGVFPRPVVVGPYTFLALAKAADTAPEGFVPLDRLDELVEVYVELLGMLSDAGVTWVQFDEPAAALDLDAGAAEALRRAYLRLGQASTRPAILVSTYFADPVEGLRALADTPVEALGVDLVRGPAAEEVASISGLAGKTLVLGVVDGRNVWRTDLRAALGRLQQWFTVGGDVAVSTSCSLLHVPYDVSVETELDPSLRSVLAFADQKVAEVVALHRALSEGVSAVQEAIHASDRAIEGRAGIPGLSVPDVAQRLDRVRAADRTRVSQSERDSAQADWLGLPALPTTTIGSYPQTGDVRRTRAAFRRGELDETAYRDRMRDEIRSVVSLQERLGLDVLVHGEPERNDMVQYFAELLDGYATTVRGWVQSYGSRCVRPPILYGDIRRPTPMTLEWISYAQGLTSKPVKGMLTGPVTMLAWSFVREDQPRRVTADQVALALRDEVSDLEAAGIGIIQVDEPALRETLPLRGAEQQAYLDWAVAAFRLATSGVAPRTQIHTHLCYSEFGEIIDAIDGLEADVTSIEAARSRMEVLGDVAGHGFSGALGPGVYDIHSPRVPDRGELVELLHDALRHVPAAKLWVNPDCGLKTRGYAEVEPALGNLVAAARSVRGTLG